MTVISKLLTNKILLQNWQPIVTFASQSRCTGRFFLQTAIFRSSQHFCCPEMIMPSDSFFSQRFINTALVL